MDPRDKTTISRILPPLFRKGLIEKSQHPLDARSYVVKLNLERESVLYVTLQAVKNHYENRVFSALSQEEQRQFLFFILKMRKSLGDE